MSQRDMSYSLDGVFATRNQGQLISSQKTQTKMVRTPGLVAMPQTGKHYPLAKTGGHRTVFSGLSGLTDATVNVPLFGTVSVVMLGGIALGAWLLFKK